MNFCNTAVRTTVDGLLGRIATGGEITSLDVLQAYDEIRAERDSAQAQNAELRAALQSAFFAMGRAGANANTKHICRPAWIVARAALARTQS